VDEIDLVAQLANDCNGNGVLDSCESPAGGDFDGSGDLTIADYEALAEECLAGPGATPNPELLGCVGFCLASFDFDGDDDVDAADFARFQAEFAD